MFERTDHLTSCLTAPRRRRSFLTAAIVLPVSLMVPGDTAAAQAELQGRVMAETGRRALANAEVAVPRLGLRTLSDSLGRYRLMSVPSGEHLVVTRAVGFHPDSLVTVFEGDEALVADVLLKPAVNALEAVHVVETSRPVVRGKMAAYAERKAAGIGHFIDRDKFAKDENRRLSDIVGSNVPGVSIYRGGSSNAWVASSRTMSTAKCAMCKVSRNELLDDFDVRAGAPLACYLDVYLDGSLIYDSSARKTPLFNLNSMSPSEIEAVEVYSGPSQTPTQYNKTSGGCGVMLIWTRTGR
jgi:hypothetical protein